MKTFGQSSLAVVSSTFRETLGSSNPRIQPGCYWRMGGAYACPFNWLFTVVSELDPSELEVGLLLASELIADLLDGLIATAALDVKEKEEAEDQEWRSRSVPWLQDSL
jgi:hypothetical protein